MKFHAPTKGLVCVASLSVQATTSKLLMSLELAVAVIVSDVKDHVRLSVTLLTPDLTNARPTL